jgi:hypothetical protein
MTVKLAEIIKAKYELSPCTDCGVSFPYECMDFDHLDPSDKEFTIRQIRLWVDSPSNRLVMNTELAKCEFVCKNCHATRTKNARQAGLIKDGRPRKGDSNG